MDPFGMISADHEMRRHVLSARPDAPIVPDRPKRSRTGPPRFNRLRSAAATSLRHLASWVEPRRAPSRGNERCQPALR